MFWNKNKRKNDFSNIISLNNTGELIFSSGYSFLLPVSRAILCVLLTIGSICGYASCFGAEFNITYIFCILMTFSLLTAFIRDFKSTFLKNSSFIIIMIVYIFSILRLYPYVNSGYHSIVNLTYASLENYLDIPALVYYEEIIENSYTTITVFLIFLGIFELLLFHMWIGDRINLLTILLVSFGPYIVPLFIELYPHKSYLFCLLCAYITIIILRFCFHLNSHPEKSRSYTVYRRHNPWSVKVRGFSYGANGLTYFSSLVFSVIVSMVIIISIYTIVPYSSYINSNTESTLKASASDGVKYLVTFGLSGLFNEYSSTGGLNDGMLGGISSVRPDYETDLTVTYVPVSSDTIYLRGFVGMDYEDRRWYPDSLTGYDVLLYREYERLHNTYSPLKASRMLVTNAGANVMYSYSPYYTYPEDAVLLESDNTQTYFFRNSVREYNYYNYISSFRQTSVKDVSPDPLYLSVPEETKAAIYKFLETENILTEYIDNNTDEGSYLSGAKLQNVLNTLSFSLSDKFKYSLNPGITPEDSDFVDYFLNTSKKGFCAHFATSAALILRTLGIPARYVEGYVLTYEDLINGTPLPEENISDYIDNSLIETNMSVVSVDIADDKAHAWVEYYDPEFGWRVFEATTASFDSEASEDFWSAIYRLFSPAADNGSDNGLAAIGSNVTITDYIYKILVFVILSAFCLALLFVMWKYIKRYRSYHRNRKNINVRNYYKIICSNVSNKHRDFDYILGFENQFDFLKSHYRINPLFNVSNTYKITQLLERAAFSNKEISDVEYAYAMKLLRILRFNVFFCR